MASTRIAPLALAAALAAGLLGYFLGSAAPVRADLDPKYEYKVLTVLEFNVQGERIPGENWVSASHLDMPHKKAGDALIKERAIMTRVLNSLATDGWEPFMMFENHICVRRPSGK